MRNESASTKVNDVNVLMTQPDDEGSRERLSLVSNQFERRLSLATGTSCRSETYSRERCSRRTGLLSK